MITAGSSGVALRDAVGDVSVLPNLSEARISLRKFNGGVYDHLIIADELAGDILNGEAQRSLL